MVCASSSIREPAMTFDAPLSFLCSEVVRPEWIDYNEHMNIAFYMMVFDKLTDAFLDHIGLDSAHRAEHGITTMALETHTVYLRELRLGSPMAFGTRLIDFDAKRMHYIQLMYHAGEAYLAATNEQMQMHLSQETRRAAPMHETVLAKLAAIKADQAGLPIPPQAGRRIGFGSGRAG
jgi:acyl-CoA thioester hydrolase